MALSDGLGVRFVAGFGPIVKAARESGAFYRDTLGLPLKAMEHNADYLLADDMEGVKHFALWPLASAAVSCFGDSEWPAHTPEPNAWIEFDVDDVAAASAALKAKGCTLLVDNRVEPWGQTVTRLLSPEGILVGITFTPWLRS